MKNILVPAVLLLLSAQTLSAQYDDEEQKGKFKKENIFIGSSLNLGVSSGIFQIGANPEIGYSITKWLDAGISTNINYTSFRYSNGVSDRYFVYGGGAFARIWPVRFLFLTSQQEYNWINITRKDQVLGTTTKAHYNSNSVLLGAGYGNRVIGQSYSYIAIMFDASHNINSPYRDEYGRAIPIFRAGFAVYLRPKEERK